jgi:hypothetical protein
MSMRILVVPVVGLVALATAGPAAALEASGLAVSVLRDTSASGPGGDRALETKGPVYSGDVIKTNRRGTAQILFADNTKMVVGPNSQVAVDDFVFSGSSTASTFAINALRGSFRFITGASAKTAYSINTPTATIGVRGTAFDGHVAKDGTTTIAMWHGTVRLCDKATPRRCLDISGTCSMVQLAPHAGFNRVNDVYKRTDILDRLVPFAFRQAQLTSEFRVSSSGCAIRNLDPPLNPNSHDQPPAPPAPAPTRAPD